MPSMPRQAMSDIRAITLMATRTSIKVKPRAERRPVLGALPW
jgi:hypothetical protein